MTAQQPSMPLETAIEQADHQILALVDVGEEKLLLSLFYAIAGPSEDRHAAAIQAYAKAYGWKQTLWVLAGML